MLGKQNGKQRRKKKRTHKQSANKKRKRSVFFFNRKGLNYYTILNNTKLCRFTKNKIVTIQFLTKIQIIKSKPIVFGFLLFSIFLKSIKFSILKRN